MKAWKIYRPSEENSRTNNSVKHLRQAINLRFFTEPVHPDTRMIVVIEASRHQRVFLLTLRRMMSAVWLPHIRFDAGTVLKEFDALLERTENWNGWSGKLQQERKRGSEGRARERNGGNGNQIRRWPPRPLLTESRPLDSTCVRNRKMRQPQ